MYAVPFEKPTPDFEQFVKVIKGEKSPERVHFVELLFDSAITGKVMERYFHEDWLPQCNDPNEKIMLENIAWWYRMGYDYVRFIGIDLGFDFALKWRQTEDTAELSHGTRNWVEEGTGMITSWEDYEKYPWPKAENFNYSSLEYVAKHLPEGMGFLVCPSSGVFENASEYLLGFENMSYLMFDDPELVEAVFNRVGELLYAFYENALEIDGVTGIFQGDDLGYKTSTIISADCLRKWVFPWHKKYVEQAHKRDMIYILHCCGNLTQTIDDLIDDVKIDALHSFEDAIRPIGKFIKQYGDRIGCLGGIDVDKLCRYSEPELRKYVQDTLAQCMPGPFALGSGNSVANYVPVDNYLIMMDEGARWDG